jgi:glycoside/pentoside/hexuronide:cation symporter, GPH family
VSASATSTLPGVLPRGLPLWVKVLYGVGDIPITILMGIFGLFVLFFYNSVMGLSSLLVGIGTSAGLVLDAVLDPYIGYLSDRSRHWLGRRHAFMLPGAVIMGPCFFLLFSPPRGLPTAGLFLWLLGCSVALRASSAVYRIPYLSLGAELSQDYDDRTRTMAVRALFGLFGTLAASSLSFLLFFPPTADGSEPKLQYAGYPRLGLVFGCAMTLTALIGFFGTLRCRTYAGQHTPAAPARTFFSGFRISMQNRAFRSIWLAVVLFFLAVVLNAIMAIQYFTWYARIHGGGPLSGIQACFYLGALAGVFFWVGVARHAEKRTLFLIATAAAAILLAGATLFIGEGSLFGTGNPMPLLVGHAVGGVFASAVWVIPASLPGGALRPAAGRDFGASDVVHPALPPGPPYCAQDPGTTGRPKFFKLSTSPARRGVPKGKTTTETVCPSGG